MDPFDKAKITPANIGTETNIARLNPIAHRVKRESSLLVSQYRTTYKGNQGLSIQFFLSWCDQFSLTTPLAILIEFQYY